MTTNNLVGEIPTEIGNMESLSEFRSRFYLVGKCVLYCQKSELTSFATKYMKLQLSWDWDGITLLVLFLLS